MLFKSLRRTPLDEPINAIIYCLHMKYILQLLLITLVFNACSPNKKTLSDYTSDVLTIKKIGDHIYQHTSFLPTKSHGVVPCNGMIYFNENEAIIFDTPVNEKASRELINWLGEKHIKAVVVSHFHIDCLGGLKEFHSKEIPSYATNQTIQLAKENNKNPLPQKGFDREFKFLIGNKAVYAKYFGEGHTKDNIVGYIPSEKALFGGCLVKQVNAPKGNLADATVSEWPTTVTKIKKELPDLEIVIPGHGKNGGTELLDYTINLFKEKPNRFVFFLHNRFLEEHHLNDTHSEYGRTEYIEILNEFKKNGFTVISEQRKGNVNAREYATRVVQQIDSLTTKGINPKHITVVGTSKGGYIAQYVSTIANNPLLNFVFIASFRDSDIQNIPEINFCGNILTIYEKSDPFGVSAIQRKQNSICEIQHFKEIQLNTGMKHGFLFKPLKQWISPTIQWARGNYNLGKTIPFNTNATNTPLAFKPELTPKNKIIHKGIFSPDFKHYYYTISDKDFKNFDIYAIKRIGNEWSKPKKTFINSSYDDHGMSFSPDGNTLYFSSTRPVNIKGIPSTWHIWKSEKVNGVWSTPIFVDIPNLRDKLVSHPVITNSGTLYFHSSNTDYSEMDIYSAKQVNNSFQDAQKVSIPSLTHLNKCTPYISPDESYLLFATVGKQLDLQVSFNDGKGNWTNTKRFNNEINSYGQGNPYVTPDNKFLFFTTGGYQEINWTIKWINIESELKLK